MTYIKTTHYRMEQISITPEILILELIQPDIPEVFHTIIHHIIYAVRQIIARNWKSTDIPSIKDY